MFNKVKDFFVANKANLVRGGMIVGGTVVAVAVVVVGVAVVKNMNSSPVEIVAEVAPEIIEAVA